MLAGRYGTPYLRHHPFLDRHDQRKTGEIRDEADPVVSAEDGRKVNPAGHTGPMPIGRDSTGREQMERRGEAESIVWPLRRQDVLWLTALWIFFFLFSLLSVDGPQREDGDDGLPTLLAPRQDLSHVRGIHQRDAQTAEAGSILQL